MGVWGRAVVETNLGLGTIPYQGGGTLCEVGQASMLDWGQTVCKRGGRQYVRGGTDSIYPFFYKKLEAQNVRILRKFLKN